MLGARMRAGLDSGLVSRARRVLPSLDECLEELVAEGYLATREGRLAPTERGWLLGNELYERLWDLAPGDVLEM